MSDKTFSETQGHAPFDWNRWLDRAIMEEPSEEEYLMAHRKSGEWALCACGNQCAIIPRMEKSDGFWGIGTPIDPELRGLGLDFMEKVRKGEWGSAKYTLLQIEQRSAVLIEEELEKLNQK